MPLMKNFEMTLETVKTTTKQLSNDYMKDQTKMVPVLKIYGRQK
jgi:hypothetical protein